MYFNSISFLAFFAAVFVLSRAISSWPGRKLCLLVFSYLFYAAWNPPFVLLLLGSTVIDWYLAGRMHGEPRVWARRLYLWVSLFLNLGVLAIFKYTNFLIANIASLGWAVGASFEPASFSITLPVGISFYTFQSLSYTIDVYRGKVAPCESILDFALYISFFPQLVAGPIVRAGEFLPQCAEPKRASGNQIGWGCMLMVTGLFGKMFVADTMLAPAVEAVYDAKGPVGFRYAWIGTLAFSIQIFCDFWGYSLCAVGAALALGFQLPSNFRAPYASIGFSDFWRRWHVSLSTWMRDYLYIPLGGGRVESWRTAFNLLFTMLLVGLWHGASWMFVIWGGLHGVLLVGERLLRTTRLASLAIWKSWFGRTVLIALTYALVCIAWVFFRAPDLSRAWILLQAMAGVGPPAARWVMPWNVPYVVVGVVVVVLVLHRFMRERQLSVVSERIPWWIHAPLFAFMISGIFLSLQSKDRAFIYFQF